MPKVTVREKNGVRPVRVDGVCVGTAPVRGHYCYEFVPSEPPMYPRLKGFLAPRVEDVRRRIEALLEGDASEPDYAKLLTRTAYDQWQENRQRVLRRRSW